MSGLTQSDRRCGKRRTVFFAAVLTSALLLWCCSPAGAQVQWRSGAVPQKAQTPQQVRSSLIDLGARDNAGHIIMQFSEPVSAEVRQTLGDTGIELLAYLGNDSFFAALSGEEVDVAAIARTASLVSVGPISRNAKLHPMLAEGSVPEWAVVGLTASTDGHTAEEIVGAYVLFHADVPVRPDGVDAVLRHGGVIRGFLSSVKCLVIELPYSHIAALADEDVVQWIEPPLPKMSEVNDSIRVITEVNTVQASPYNLDGSGTTVLVYDGGTGRASHDDFGGRLSVHDSSGMSYHATHVSGTIGGSGTASSGTYKGMAPGVTMLAYGLEQEGGLQEGFLYSDPCDIEDDYSEAISSYGADIANNSIGTNTASNGFPCDWEGNYGVTSNLIDTIVRGDGSNPLFDEPFRIIWANGNERGGTARCGETYHTTAPPACAKNHIAVGALNSNDDTMTGFSSWGPTDDDRLKPDICAPGCQSSGDNGVTSCDDDNDQDYTVLCGTSMASPTVCGIGALIIEDFRAYYSGQPLFRNSTLKALLAHTATDLGTTGPDYIFGYGSVRAQQAIDFMRTGQFLEGNVTQGATFSRTVEVSPGDPELRVTLAWDDFPGTPNVTPVLVNDLDLRVYSPSMTRHYPWTLGGLADPSAAAVRTQEDHVNNIEQVLVDSPQTGTWTIEVYGYSVPEGPQSFSLVGDGAANTVTTITYPSGLPDYVAPGTSTVIDVEVVSIGETTVPGSPTLYYRYSGGSFTSQPLTHVSGTSYEATLPPAGCDDTPQYYFSAEGSASGVVYNPLDAPVSFFTADVGEQTTIFSDNFESDQGWTEENLGASSGDWQRGVPVNDSDWDYDPVSDSDGSGQCYLTQNEYGNTDVDDGAVRLTSPTMDMSGGNITITYDYFLRLTRAGDYTDHLIVEMNNNGGAGGWTEVTRHSTDGGLSWRSHTIDQDDLDTAGVVLTSTMKIRFTTNDADEQSINESGLDAFVVTGFSCESSATCDDGILNQGEDRIDCGGPCPPCECTSDGACSDGQFCNGVETCDDYGDCQDGTDVDCDDDVNCTEDSCNEGTDSCDNIPNDELCDDGAYCNGSETCHVLFGCQDGVDVDCDDDVTCTVDSCNEGTDSCDNIPNDGLCDDGAYCNGSETCHAALGCQDGVDVDCDDSVMCTEDSCNEDTDSCDNIPNDGLCDDGAYCNGTETCDVNDDCQSGTNPCDIDEWCDEVNDVCLEQGNGDMDADGDVDLDDFVIFQVCFGGVASGGCEPGDMVVDGVIDLDDFTAFVAAMTGPQ